MTSTEGETSSFCARPDWATAALIQNCTEAQLVELPAGKVPWTRPTEGALALLAEVDPVDIGYPFLRTLDFLPAINRRGRAMFACFLLMVGL